VKLASSLKHKGSVLWCWIHPPTPVFHSPSHLVQEACTTYGLRAKFGLLKLLIWPAKSQIFFILLVSLIKTPFECVKNITLWPLDKSKKMLDPPWDLSCAPLFCSKVKVIQLKSFCGPIFFSISKGHKKLVFTLLKGCFYQTNKQKVNKFVVYGHS